MQCLQMRMKLPLNGQFSFFDIYKDLSLKSPFSLLLGQVTTVQERDWSRAK